MNLKSMKMSPAEKKKTDGPQVQSKEDSYPYGLCLNLESEAIKKLGLSKLPKVGTILMVTAKAKVLGTALHESGDEKRKSISMQITDLSLDNDSKEPEDKFYEEDSK
jgi:hypothetical protein